MRPMKLVDVVRLALLLTLFAPCLATTSAASRDDSEADLSVVLKQRTAAFAEASQTGDAAVLSRCLDPEVVFTNESGDVAGRQDLLDGARPPPPGAPKRRSEIVDWALHRQGADLATATFVDRVTTEIGRQVLTLTFRSTETWAKRSGVWRMIASQTMNVPRPPAARELPATELADYVGTYQLGDVYTVKITLRDGGLAARVNDGPPVPLQAEIKDVLFTPAAPNVRRIFQRGPDGRVTGYVNRRDGADLVFRKVDRDR